MQLRTKPIFTGLSLCLFLTVTALAHQQPDHEQDGLKTKNVLSSISSLLNSAKTTVDEIRNDEEITEKIDHMASCVKEEVSKVIENVARNVPKQKLSQAKEVCEKEFTSTNETVISTLDVLGEELDKHGKKLKQGLTETLGEKTIQKIKTEVETSAKKIKHKFEESKLQEDLEKVGKNIDEEGTGTEKSLIKFGKELETECKKTLAPIEEKLEEKLV